MKHIKVLKHFDNLNPGEVAGFDDDVAVTIIKRELGVEVKLDKEGNVVGGKESKVEG